MPSGQAEQMDTLRKLQEQLSQQTISYWLQYSNMGTWQFWLIVAMILLPLIALYFFIDRQKAFRIGFFGFNVHVWFLYIDLLGTRHGLWEYPYKAIPFAPMNFALDAALVPVVFMLVYQWSINHDVNYYFTLTGISILFAGAVKPLMSAFDLFVMYKWMNFLYLFFGYIIIMLVSVWITNLFMKLRKATNFH